MHEHQVITLLRDCEAVLIPSGTPLLLQQGTEVLITQALGGSWTVNVNGNLARIGPLDADALGFAIDPTLAAAPVTTGDGTVDEEQVWARDRKSTRLNSSHSQQSRMPSSA